MVTHNHCFTRSLCRRLVLFLPVFLLLLQLPVHQAAADLRVGIREIRPFIFLNPGQEPTGYTIDLWKAVAEEQGWQYHFVPSKGIAATLDDMKNGKIDLAIGAITITEQREKPFDFSVSHFHTGLGIMTPIQSGYSASAMISSFFTKARLLKMGSFFLFLLISAHVIWLVERRHQSSFHRNYFPGVLEGIYWSIVTASTVGYGDYTPKSKIGKFLAVVIIIVSLPLFAVFVANISSDITLHQLHDYINGPKDLLGKQVGVVKGSTSEGYLRREHLGNLHEVNNVQELFAQLQQGGLDAVVHDLPTLEYYAHGVGLGKVKVVGKMFDRQDYAFLLQDASQLKEPLDRTLLKLGENGTMADLNKKWFGNEEGL